MAGINKDYVASLLEMARKEGRLEELYHSAICYARGERGQDAQLPQELRELICAPDERHEHPLLERFLALAGQELQIVDVEVISAVPLTQAQLTVLEQKMIQVIKKRLNIKTVVDPSLIGGLRVVVGNHAVDSSIRGQLERFKQQLYEGVYFHHEFESP